MPGHQEAMNHLRFTIRQLLKNPGFSGVAILTLALGVGACTATFSLFHAVLLKPLPFHEPNDLVWMQNWTNGSFSDQASRMDDYLDWKALAPSFQDIGGFSPFYDVERNVLSSGAPPPTSSRRQGHAEFLGDSWTPSDHRSKLPA